VTHRESKSQFLEHSLLGGGDLEVDLVPLDRLLMATTKKVINFFEKKCTSRQNPGYAYEHHANISKPKP